MGEFGFSGYNPAVVEKFVQQANLSGFKELLEGFAGDRDLVMGSVFDSSQPTGYGLIRLFLVLFLIVLVQGPSLELCNAVHARFKTWPPVFVIVVT